MAEPTIFLTLPTADLSRSRGFYAALGWGFDERFEEEGTTCVVASAALRLWLRRASPALALTPLEFGLSLADRAAVDALAAAALRGGGREEGAPQEGPGRYARTLVDPDGHRLALLWLDLNALEPSLPAEMDAAVEA